MIPAHSPPTSVARSSVPRSSCAAPPRAGRRLSDSNLMEFDDLEFFKNWWLNNRPINTYEGAKPCYHANIVGTVLYRQYPYQVQLFITPPNTLIEEHLHPNVDSFEVYLNGDIAFTCNGHVFDSHKIGESIRVKTSYWHGGKTGKLGATFLSIQKWLNGEQPSSVANDWHDAKNQKSGNEVNITRIE
jgi:hypothetical protein